MRVRDTVVECDSAGKPVRSFGEPGQLHRLAEIAFLRDRRLAEIRVSGQAPSELTTSGLHRQQSGNSRRL